MSHSRELIRMIAEKIFVDYPEAEGYEYVYERSINGTRMMPDIHVLRGRKVVCAVEIGYTRPEKLTAYRKQLSIPDVRWYSKDGTLHGDVEERIVRVTMDVQPPGTLYFYHLHDEMQCEECDSLGMRLPDDRVAARYIRRFGQEAYDDLFGLSGRTWGMARHEK
jgi:hypothetical protein